MKIQDFLQMATDTSVEDIILFNYDEHQDFYYGKIDDLIENAEEYPESDLAAILDSELRQWDVCNGSLNINFDWFDIYDDHPELLKKHLEEN